MATILSPEAKRDIGALIKRMIEARDSEDYRLIEFTCEQLWQLFQLAKTGTVDPNTGETRTEH